jgi:hypothetical protein
VVRRRAGQQDAWQPLWFPAFGSQSGEFVELQPEPGRAAGQLWSFHSHAPEVYTSYDSLFRTTLELWRAGLLPSEGPMSPRGLRELVASQNPASQRPNGPSRRLLSCFPTPEWPAT